MTLKVLLVEDSATVAAYVVSILGPELDLNLLPVASTAELGVEMAQRERPDVILMDIKLPDHDGLWAIEQIMADVPCPIVVLSGHLSSRERNITFESLRAGAVDVLAKPTGLTPAAREAFRQSLVSTVRLMSSAVVVRRSRPVGRPGPKAAPQGTCPVPIRELARIRYVLFGASTGGPEVLYRMLAGLGAPFRHPLLITQHTLEGFDESLAQWMSGTGHEVRLAREGDTPVPGRVYLTPADCNVEVTPTGLHLIAARRREPVDAVDAMFASAARTWGDQCLAVLLSGMGKDGAQGMRALHERGALTIAQSPETCVVSSMPDSARARHAVRHVLSPEEILQVCRQLSNNEGASPADARRRG